MATDSEPTAIEAFSTPHCSGRVVAAAKSDLEELWRVEDPEAWADMELVKASTVRRVFRTRCGDRDVHVKLFRAVRLSDRARDAVGGSRAGREFDQLLRARERGLTAVEPLAAGTFRGTFGARSFLVTATAPGAEALPAHPWTPALAEAVGRALRRAHDAGLHAPDLHRGNLLAAPDGTLWLLDLTGAHLAQPVEDADRARAMAFFFQHLDGGAAAPEAVPVWRAYAHGDLDHPRFVALRDRALRASRRLRHRALQAFGRRAFRPCRHTEVPRHHALRGRLYLHRPTQALHSEALTLLADPRGAETIKEGRRGGVFQTEHLVAKTRTAAHARKLFRAAYWLLFAGVASPAPVALVTREKRGVVATVRLPGPNLLQEWSAGALSPDDVVRAARSLGDSVGRLHAHGLRHRDLKWDNLVRFEDRVFIVDLDGVRRKLPSDGRGIGADLGRILAAWTAEQQPGGVAAARAFLRAYLRARRNLLAPGLTPHDLRTAQQRAAAWATAHPAPPA